MKTKLLNLFFIVTLSLIVSVGCSYENNTSSNDNNDEVVNEDINLEDSKVADLMGSVEKSEIDTSENLNVENTTKLTDFGVNLLKNSKGEGENVLISPVSVLYALGMTQNGADGETLQEMEEVMGISSSELNGYLNAYLTTLPNDENNKFILANSIWLNEEANFVPNEEFLKTNKDYYDASIFEAPFNEETVSLINSWVNENTQGMIEKLVNELPKESIMVLINALSLDAKWDIPYTTEQISEDEFTKEDGEVQNVEFMNADLYNYIEGDSEIGLKKDYMDSKYSFVALLPNEDLTIDDYVENLSGEKIQNLLTNVEEVGVETSIPKFKVEYSNSLVKPLTDMGLNKGFSESEADFNKMGESEENIYIGDVIHKTFIEVDEVGTKAGAVTGVVLETTAAPIEKKVVYLNRPFVYMIIDNENNHPIFLGTIKEIEK